MTFSKVLKGTISKKRKQFDFAAIHLEGKQPSENQERPKKYVKRKHLEAVELAEIQDDTIPKYEEKDEKQVTTDTAPSSSRQISSNTHSHQNQGEEETSPSTTDPFIDIPDDEVVRRLRAKGQPIRYFGETDSQRVQRLRMIETMEEKDGGQRNDFMAALHATDTGLTLELLRSTMGDQAPAEPPKPKKKTKQDLDTSEISMELLQSNPEKNCLLIYVYFKRLLKEWEEDLGNRPERLKRSTPGKLDAAKQKQTIQYLQPFFKQLKLKQIPDDVIGRITEITSWMQRREYVLANDAYLRLSIGNAPWPIGVTMVGIHERSAREKIFSAQVAHVLNDETQRKWIQSVKRLMTFVQSKYPPDDLAKCVG